MSSVCIGVGVDVGSGGLLELAGDLVERCVLVILKLKLGKTRVLIQIGRLI